MSRIVNFETVDQVREELWDIHDRLTLDSRNITHAPEPFFENGFFRVDTISAVTMRFGLGPDRSDFLERYLFASVSSRRRIETIRRIGSRLIGRPRYDMDRKAQLTIRLLEMPDVVTSSELYLNRRYIFTQDRERIARWADEYPLEHKSDSGLMPLSEARDYLKAIAACAYPLDTSPNPH